MSHFLARYLGSCPYGYSGIQGCYCQQVCSLRCDKTSCSTYLLTCVEWSKFLVPYLNPPPPLLLPRHRFRHKVKDDLNLLLPRVMFTFIATCGESHVALQTLIVLILEWWNPHRGLLFAHTSTFKFRSSIAWSKWLGLYTSHMARARHPPPRVSPPMLSR
jgi:hypothetical protein